MSAILQATATVVSYGILSYASFLALLAIPSAQRFLIFLHRIKFPFNVDYNVPEQVGHAPGNVINLRLDTPDGEKLGAWLVLPYGQDTREDVAQPRAFDNKLPCVLYFHGNAATRAADNRVRVARHMSNEGHNFFIIDYRGFADSTGTPSEAGLLIDARRAWDYLTVDKGVPAAKITIMGQSLGTGVSAALCSQLANENISPKALILVAPFSSIAHLLEDYRLFNYIPILSPLKYIPFLFNTFTRFLHTKFDTKSVIGNVTCPILILHAQDDNVIPYLHSKTLAHHLLDPLLPSEASAAVVDSDHTRAMTNGPAKVGKDFKSAKTGKGKGKDAAALLLADERAAARARLVSKQRIGQWGVVSRFSRGEGKGAVTWADALRGKHNNIGTDEMSIKLIAEVLHARG